MAAWSGWETAVLKRGGWPASTENVRFLSEWHSFEQSACRNNPLNTTLRLSGSTRCNPVGVQSYPTQTMGSTATVDTLKGFQYTAIVAALKTGDPFTYPASATVALELQTWGTPHFATAYLQQAGGSQPGSTGGTTQASATASGLRGYADLRNSVARHLPTQLLRSRQTGEATLRKLAQRHKVKG